MKKNLLLGMSFFSLISFCLLAEQPPAAPAHPAASAFDSDGARDLSKCKLSSFYSSSGTSFNRMVDNGIKRTANLQERVFLKLACNPVQNNQFENVEVSIASDGYKYNGTSLSVCTPASTGLCIEKLPNVTEDSVNHSQVFKFSLVNLSSNDIGIDSSKKINLKINVAAKKKDDSSAVSGDFTIDFTDDVILKRMDVIPMSCEITVGGAQGAAHYKSCSTSGSCNFSEVKAGIIPPGQVPLHVEFKGKNRFSNESENIEWFINDELQSGDAGENISRTFSSETRIKAQITYAGQAVACIAKVKPDALADGVKISIRKAGDCEVFKDMRKIYYRKKEANGWSANVLTSTVPSFTRGDSSDLIKYEGNPFAGVLNLAMGQGGSLEVSAFGDISLPVARTYEKAVIQIYLAKDPQKKAIYEASLNPSDYKTAIFQAIGAGNSADDDDKIILRAFLRTSRKAGEPREFIAANSNGSARDKIIPFAYKSCDPMSMIYIQAANGWSEGDVASVKNTGFCLTTRPMSFADFKNGNIAVNILHIAPEQPNAEYPVALLKAKSNPKKCASAVATSSDPATDCWAIPPSAMPDTTVDGVSHLTCQKKMYACVSVGAIYDRYGKNQAPACSAAPSNGPNAPGTCGYNCVQQEYLTYKPGCVIAEDDGNECTSSLAMRFDGYNQMMVAALGCAVKYDKSGVSVSPTLSGEGIIPYTSFGGSAPNNFSSYSGITQGYACVPCRFAPATSTVANLPVDQTGNGVSRKPIYTFSKTKMPESCTQETNMEVRYFGSSACDGVHAPAGHFCSSGNITQQSCPSSEGGAGGNVAGKFTLRLCAGSQFGATDVAASWSPIILDIKGQGIEISRHFKHSVMFDIKGRGAKDRIDWPVNTSDVAFLVRPNKLGKVESIKELFGDYNKAKNGFEALKEFDSNRDGMISEKDKDFEKLALWFDYNRDATAQAEELVELSREGVTSISLKYLKADAELISGKGLNSLYYNRMLKRFLNAKDVYFYEYNETGHKVKIKNK